MDGQLIQSWVPLEPELEAVIARIAQTAEDTDRFGVPRSHIDSLALVGAHGLAKDPQRQRELTERLAGADASTWFCWTQHQTPLRTMLAGGNQPAAQKLSDRWLKGLESGDVLAAIAFAHVRRGGPANPVVHQVDGGWELTGKLDWVTSWDIADVLMLLAATEDKSKFVVFYLPVADFENVFVNANVGAPLDLLAMSGTHSRPIEFDHTFISEECVFGVIDAHEWLEADSLKTVLPNPAALGVARAAIEELNRVSIIGKQAKGEELAHELATRFEDLRTRSYQEIDHPDSSRGDSSRGDLVALRVEILEFVLTCSVAVVTATSGSAMVRGNSAERRVREAIFLQVQAQTQETRDAMLARSICEL